MLTNSVAGRRDSEDAGENRGALLLLQRVNGSSPVPLYLQVRSILADAVRSGLFAAGSQLPSTVDIARQLRVSMLTAHRALQQLARDGWLQRSRGQGTFVRSDYRAALARAARFRIAVAMRRNVSMRDSEAWSFLAELQSAAAEMLPPTERIVQYYDAAAELEHVLADGLICIRPEPDDVCVLEALSRERPVIVVDASTESAALESVDSADLQGVRDAVRHLIELGHEHIALCLHRIGSGVAQSQLRGFKLEMGVHGLEAGEEYILSASEPREEWLQRLDGMVGAANGVTAVIAGNLELALRIRAALQHRGLDVPQDVSLIGFGDEWFAELLTPPMTVIAQPLEGMARQAFSRLLQTLSGKPRNWTDEPLPTRLVARGSTAPPPRAPGGKTRLARTAITSTTRRRRVRAAGRTTCAVD